MADYDSSLPVRTESDGDLDINVSDPTTPANKLAVNADGSIDVNASIPSGEKIIITDGTDDLDVNADGSINSVVSQSTHDNLNANANLQVGDADVDNANPVPISDAGGTLTVDQSTHDNLNANVNLQIGDVDVDASNPVPVEMVSDQAGDEICDYNTSSAVAKDASVNHDYTVTAAKTFLGEQVWVSGSGKLKVEVLVNAVSKFVGFNSTSMPNIEIPLKKICKANATEVIRITITNRDNQAQDVYSTLLGLEV